MKTRKARQPTFRERELSRKRTLAVKFSLIDLANAAVERLWAASNQGDSGFTAGERRSIADASYSIRSIKGGWAGGRR